MIIPGTEKKLRVTHPELWAGPSLLIVTVSGAAIRVFASGYFLRLAFWERPNDSRVEEALDVNGLLQPQLLDALADSKSVLVELEQDERAAALATEIVKWLDHSLTSVSDISELLPDFMSVSGTANKLPDLPAILGPSELLDLTATSMPNRHGMSEFPLSFCQRRCRLLHSAKWCLAVWEALSESDHEAWELWQRWPHHGIPGFAEILDRKPLFESVDDGSVPPLIVVERILRNEIYFLANLGLEINLAESNLYHAMHHKSGQVPTLFVSSVDQIAQLSRFTQMVISSARRLRRRLEVSSLRPALVETAPALGTSFALALDTLDERVALARTELRGALNVLTSSTEVVRLRHEVESRRRAERFREAATAVAVAFSLISLILAGYGANLRELSPGATGSLLSVVLASFLVIAVVALAFLGRIFVRDVRRKE